jgi:hypothetical protein
MKRIVLSLLAYKGGGKRIIGQYLNQLGAHVILVKDVLTAVLAAKGNEVIRSEIRRCLDKRKPVPGEILADVLMPVLKPRLRQDPSGLFVLNGMDPDQLSVLEERLEIFRTRSHRSPIENALALLKVPEGSVRLAEGEPAVLTAVRTVCSRVGEFDNDPANPKNVAVQIYAWAYELRPDLVANRLKEAS